MQILRDRVVGEVFGSNNNSSLEKIQSWKILVLDAITLKIVSSVCTMTTLHEHQVSNGRSIIELQVFNANMILPPTCRFHWWKT